MTAFPQWDQSLRAEYMQELIIEALRRIPAYDRRRMNADGQTASFLTYVKPYLLEVRWRLAGRESPIPVGKETIRMRAFGQRFISDQVKTGGAVPSWHEVAEAIGKAHGKSVSPERAEALCQPVAVIRPDKETNDSSGPQWSELRVTAPSPEDELLDMWEQAETDAAVRDALSRHATTDLQRMIVERRLTAESPASLKQLAADAGISIAKVKAEETALRDALRAELTK